VAINQKNYFKLNKDNAKDGRDCYFYFGVKSTEDKIVEIL